VKQKREAVDGEDKQSNSHCHKEYKKSTNTSGHHKLFLKINLNYLKKKFGSYMSAPNKIFWIIHICQLFISTFSPSLELINGSLLNLTLKMPPILNQNSFY
jgi:hypothetical protein